MSRGPSPRPAPAPRQDGYGRPQEQLWVAACTRPALHAAVQDRGPAA